MTYNHDPRIPPIGRIASAKIIQLDDGEYAVEGDLELFEADDPMEPEPCARTILTRRYPPNSLYLGFDRNYDNQEDQELIADICESLHIEAEAKKGT